MAALMFCFSDLETVVMRNSRSFLSNPQGPTGQCNQADVLRFAAGLEHGAALAYVGAVPVFHNRELAKAAASILGDETMHWSILLNPWAKTRYLAHLSAKGHPLFRASGTVGLLSVSRDSAAFTACRNRYGWITDVGKFKSSGLWPDQVLTPAPYR